MNRAERFLTFLNEGAMKEIKMQIDDYFADDSRQEDYDDLAKCAKSCGGVDKFTANANVKRIAKDIGVSAESLASYFRVK